MPVAAANLLPPSRQCVAGRRSGQRGRASSAVLGLGLGRGRTAQAARSTPRHPHTGVDSSPPNADWFASATPGHFVPARRTNATPAGRASIPARCSLAAAAVATGQTASVDPDIDAIWTRLEARGVLPDWMARELADAEQAAGEQAVSGAVGVGQRDEEFDADLEQVSPAVSLPTMRSPRAYRCGIARAHARPSRGRRRQDRAAAHLQAAGVRSRPRAWVECMAGAPNLAGSSSSICVLAFLPRGVERHRRGIACGQLGSGELRSAAMRAREAVALCRRGETGLRTHRDQSVAVGDTRRTS